jgi:hypothetical protein
MNQHIIEAIDESSLLMKAGSIDRVLAVYWQPLIL